MRKIQKVAIVAAMLGTMGLVGAGTAFAGDEHGGGGDQYSVWQSTTCKSHDVNLDILGEVGLLGGLGGNLLGGEGNPGAQVTDIGSSAGCNNSAFGS